MSGRTPNVDPKVLDAEILLRKTEVLTADGQSK